MVLTLFILKTKKEHAETVAKARADMLAHEKIKAELQAKLKSETERLATRLVFKVRLSVTYFSYRSDFLSNMKWKRQHENPHGDRYAPAV